MITGLDTSVTLRLLVGEPAEQASAAWAFVAGQISAGNTLTLSDLVVSEAYFALRHHYAIPHADALKGLRSLLADPRIESSGVARAVVSEAMKSRPGFMDRLIHADYAAAGSALVTFDRDTGGLPSTTVLR